MNINTKRDWLHSRGGRTLDDLLTDEKVEYVLMQNGDKKERVRLPETYEVSPAIKRYMRLNGYTHSWEIN